jgi:hypothetical protein
MKYDLLFKKRTIVIAVAGGAFLFLAGFGYGYSAPLKEAMWRAMPSD